MSEKDVSDVTWKPVTAPTWKIGVVYLETRKRDWRFLWLRKRTVTDVIHVREWE